MLQKKNSQGHNLPGQLTCREFRSAASLRSAIQYALMLIVLISSIPASIFSQDATNSDSYGKARNLIRDLDSIVSPDGIQQSFQLNINGIMQWVFVRGQNRNNPVIVFVHGGPASPMAPLAWAFQRPLEEYFTIVHYDQRGSGKTYHSNDTTGLGKTIFIEQYVDDAVALTDSIIARYKKQKVILIGHSWGTIVAMKAALKRPDLYYAYVGIGQVINTQDNERLSVEFAIRQAKKFKNDTALAQLNSIMPYPGNKPITRERIIIARTWPQYYGGLAAYRNNFSYFFNAPLLSPEYTMADVEAIDKGSLFTLEKVLPEFLQVDFRKVKKFPLPVFMFMGRHDYTTPSAPTEAWIKNVSAPVKKGIWFENSAHLIPLEEPGKLLVTLLKEVGPLAK